MSKFKLTKDQQRAAEILTGPARRVMLSGGSRSGKTFEIVRLLMIRAMKYPNSFHCIGRLHFAHLKSSIISQTIPSVQRLCFKDVKIDINRTDWYYTFPNGSQIWLFGLDQKERVEKILGTEWGTIYLNEVSMLQWDHVNLLLTRLAARVDGMTNRLWCDQNPPSMSHWTYKVFELKQNPENGTALPDPDNWAAFRMNPDGNRMNLAEDYLLTLEALPERQRRRFLYGEYSPDILGALWGEATIDRNRVDEHPDFMRVVIAVDPATTHGEDSDETGIFVVGEGTDGHFYPVQDLSGRYSPAEWAAVAGSAFYRWRADKIVAEGNQGGEMVRATLQTYDPNLPIEIVMAKTGKITRAEDVAALYEQDRVHHVGRFAECEDQMVRYTGKPGEKSPDRMDALVYAIKYLKAPKEKGFWYA